MMDVMHERSAVDVSSPVVSPVATSGKQRGRRLATTRARHSVMVASLACPASPISPATPLKKDTTRRNTTLPNTAAAVAAFMESFDSDDSDDEPVEAPDFRAPSLRRNTALFTKCKGLRKRNCKRFSMHRLSPAALAEELRDAAYNQDDFHHAGEDYDKGDSTPAKGTATPTTPGHLEFEFVDHKKFKLSQMKSMGAFEYTCIGKEKEYKGKSILKGIAKFKANPDKYIAMTYEKKMLAWPTSEQHYSLIHRAGTERLKPAVVADDGWLTVLIQKFEYLPPFENDELPEEFQDPYTRKMTLRGLPFEKKPILPGRGMGVGDTPLTKIIGDVDPSDIHQGQIGDCWLLSAISAMGEFDGAVKKLFRKTPQLVERPLASANMYTITLWDLETWKEVDIVVDESLLAHRYDDEKLLAAQPSADGELWVCYLEKAFAIHCGGWDNITGGQCTHAWAMMTGCKHQYTIQKKASGKFYCQARYNPHEKRWLEHKNNPHHPVNDEGVYEVEWPAAGGGGFGDVDQGELFQHMYAWDLANYIVAAGSKKNTADDGIIDSHAYTVIEAVEDAAGTGINLLKLRNPWGNGEMETGMFGDHGYGWKDYPEIKELLNPVVADDGIFWITCTEFFDFFDTIYVSASDMSDFLED